MFGRLPLVVPVEELSETFWSNLLSSDWRKQLVKVLALRVLFSQYVDRCRSVWGNRKAMFQGLKLNCLS
jgi:hypothetical protein